MISIKSFVAALCFTGLFVCHSSAQPIPAFADKQFTTTQLQQDFNVLRNRYENTLANLYLYSSKSELDKLFDSLYRNIKPMTEFEFYNYIAPLQAAVKDGHSILLPAEQTTQYHIKQSRYFPFQVYIDSGHLYTAMNLSNDTTVKDGSEILSINGQTTKQVIDYLINRQVRDGHNQTFPLWILNHYFRGYYNMCYGYPATYRLQIKAEGNLPKQMEVNGTTQDTLALYKKIRYGKQAALQQNAKAIYLQTEDSTALLTIKTWDTKWLRTIYHQQFCKEIDACFKQLQQHNTRHLIIDLRDNQGGSTEYGDYLLRYLMQQPYQYCNGLYKVAHHADTGQVLKPLTAAFLHVHKPRKNNYTGKLYVIINGGSFSNSGIFCSRLQQYNRGIFIGEETGGSKTVLTGVFGIAAKKVLPNTGIICDKANYRMVITGLDLNTGHGVMPDYNIKPTVTQIIEGVDAALIKVWQLIATATEQ